MTTKTAVPAARDLMNKHVHTVSPDASLLDIVRMLSRHGISNAPVVETVDGVPRLVGFLSEQDCLDHLSNEMFFGSPAQPQTARTMMRRHPVCVSPNEDAFALASIMVSHGFRHLPVVEEDRLVGIVSRCDILKALEGYYEQWLESHDLEHFPPDLRKLINLRFVARGE